MDKSLPELVQTLSTYGHGLRASQHDKLKKIKEFFKCGLMPGSASKHMALDPLWRGPVLPDKLLQGFLNLAVVQRDIRKDNANEPQLALKQLQCSASRDGVGLVVLSCVQALKDANGDNDAGVQ